MGKESEKEWIYIYIYTHICILIYVYVPLCYISKISIALKINYTPVLGFSSGHVWMWELDCEDSWVLKNWCFWTMVLGKTLESPFDCKEIQPVHSKGDQSCMFIGRTDVKLKLQYFGRLMWRVDSLEKTLMLGGIGGRRRRGRQDEMAGWLHWLDGHELE